MGWMERQKPYKDGSKITAQSAEDMAARRVLKGLGLPNANKALYAAERQLLGEEKADAPLWDRAEPLLTYCLSRSGHRDLVDRWIMQTLEIKRDKELIERIELVDEYKDQVPLFFVRRKDKKDAYAYSLWTPEEIGTQLTPPYKVVTTCVGRLLAMQDIVHFVRQFGPYVFEE